MRLRRRREVSTSSDCATSPCATACALRARSKPPTTPRPCAWCSPRASRPAGGLPGLGKGSRAGDRRGEGRLPGRIGDHRDRDGQGHHVPHHRARDARHDAWRPGPGLRLAVRHAGGRRRPGGAGAQARCAHGREPRDHPARRPHPAARLPARRARPAAQAAAQRLRLRPGHRRRRRRRPGGLRRRPHHRRAGGPGQDARASVGAGAQHSRRHHHRVGQSRAHHQHRDLLQSCRSRRSARGRAVADAAVQRPRRGSPCSWSRTPSRRACC